MPNLALSQNVNAATSGEVAAVAVAGPAVAVAWKNAYARPTSSQQQNPRRTNQFFM